MYILKPNGKRRPLDVTTIQDRVIQIAAVLILQPIFEVDLYPEQYSSYTDPALSYVRFGWQAKHPLDEMAVDLWRLQSSTPADLT
jgi:hypothetical protein